MDRLLLPTAPSIAKLTTIGYLHFSAYVVLRLQGKKEMLRGACAKALITQYLLGNKNKELVVTGLFHTGKISSSKVKNSCRTGSSLRSISSIVPKNLACP